MQPFRSLRSLGEWPADAPETIASNQERSSRQSTSAGQIVREVAVILIVCLSLGLVAEMAVRMFGVS